MISMEFGLPLSQSEASLVKKQASNDSIKAKHAQAKAAHDELGARLGSDEELLQTLLTGLSSSNSKTKGGGYMGQLADAKQKIAQGSAEEEQAKMKLGMQKKQLADLEAKVKNHAKEAGENMKKLETLTKKLKEFERKVDETGWNLEKENNLEVMLKQAREDVKRLTEVGIIDQRPNDFNFSYRIEIVWLVA